MRPKYFSHRSSCTRFTHQRFFVKRPRKKKKKINYYLLPRNNNTPSKRVIEFDPVYDLPENREFKIKTFFPIRTGPPKLCNVQADILSVYMFHIKVKYPIAQRDN